MNLLEWWKDRLRKVEKRQQTMHALKGLVGNSHVQTKFIVMSFLSGLVATCGILLQDVSILIAAMVLAPLLNPILAMGAGITLRHSNLVWFSLRAFFVGFTTVIVTAVALTLLLRFSSLPLPDVGFFLARFQSPITLPLLLLVSFVSGFGAVYSWLQHTTEANFVGLAIAVALIPFVSYYGVAIGLSQWSELFPLTRIFLANLLVIIVGAVMAFSVLGGELDEADVDQGIRESTQN